MAITINIYYTGKDDNAINFIKEMTSLGIVEKIRNESGNLKYEYFIPYENSETILLIDKWENQENLDAHHASEMMRTITFLREKYNLTMKVERYIDDQIDEKVKKYIKFDLQGVAFKS